MRVATFYTKAEYEVHLPELDPQSLELLHADGLRLMTRLKAYFKVHYLPISGNHINKGRGLEARKVRWIFYVAFMEFNGYIRPALDLYNRSLFFPGGASDQEVVLGIGNFEDLVHAGVRLPTTYMKRQEKVLRAPLKPTRKPGRPPGSRNKPKFTVTPRYRGEK